MPTKKSAVAASTVGTTHLRSLGLSAGRKKASTCHTIMGEHITSAVRKPMVKRVVKPPSAEPM